MSRQRGSPGKHMKRACAELCFHFQKAMDVLGKPWNGLLVALLDEEGPLRFSELGERIGGISDRMLSTRLRELEAEGVVERRVDGGPPVRVVYGLTPAGQEFHSVAAAIAEWGEKLERQTHAQSSPPRPPPSRERAARSSAARRTPRATRARA